MVDEDINIEKLQLFREIIDLLNNSNITYWMDQGSLLGMIRDNRFMSWDKDVDIGIWKEDAPMLNKLLDEKIITLGARISYLPYAIKIKKKYNITVKNLPVNIRIYYQKDEYAYSEFWTVINKENRIKGKIDRKIINLLTRIGRKISGTAHVKRNIYKLFFDIVLGIREVLKTRRVIFRVDSKFFRRFKSINLYNLKLSVPEESEQYLSIKYGPDWRTPVKKWEWWKDDGAVYSTNYYFLNLKGLLFRFYR